VKVDFIEELVERVRALPDPQARNLALDLVQAVMDLHAAGLERIMKVVSETDPAGAMEAALVSDDLVSNILLLHDLHPLELEKRVLHALNRPEFRARGARVELVSANGGIVRLRIEGGPALRTAVENAVSNAAPDAASIVIEGAPAANFVPLEQLLAS
jgi:hypothetical protein